MTEHGDKVPEEVKEEVKKAVEEAKGVLESEDTEIIKEKVSALQVIRVCIFVGVVAS